MALRTLALALSLSVLLWSLVAGAQATPPPEPDAASVVGMIQGHMWWALAAAAIWFVVRTLKDDKFVLPKWIAIPSEYRPALAIGLGVVAGVVDKYAQNHDWRTALLGGLSAAVAAILGHTVVVEGFRGGRDIGAPPLDKPAIPKAPPLPLILLTFWASVFGVGTASAGCSFLQSPVVQKDAGEITKCALPKFAAGETPEQVAVECGIELLTAQKIQAAHIESKRIEAAHPASSGGTQ